MANPEELVETLLTDANGLLRGLLDNALVGVYVIQDERFVFVNRTLAAIFRYPQEAVCAGMGPLDLTAPEDHELVRRELDRRIRGEVPASFFAFHGLRGDGSLIEVEVFGVATSFRGRPAVIGILVDISERRRVERELAEQLHFVEQLIEAIPAPVFYKDEQGRYLGCNGAFEAFLGKPREALVGRSVYDISPKKLADRYHVADQALLDNPGTQTYEATVADADGNRRSVIFNKATFTRADGQLGGLVGVVLDISERKQMEEMVWREANYDALTGLPNRRLFGDRLREEAKKARRHHRGLALMYIDLDRFKEVNDTLGHRIGDLLLVEAAARIRAALRESDTVARQGGDEFLVVLPELTSPMAIGNLAHAIIDALRQPFRLEGQVAYVSASIGIALYPSDTTDLDTLLSYADQALYSAKERGRNGYCYFVPAFQEEAVARLELANDLRQALADGQLQLYYQPIVDLASGEVIKAEALLRWFHPRLGAVSPDRFIPLAEEIGLIGEIGDWVFHQAATAAQRWNARRTTGAGTPARPIQVSINKSPRQFLASARDGSWIGFLRDNALPSESVAVEITEGLLLDDRPEVVNTLLAFRDAGVEISLDDFGTGYSAMSYLKKFDIDYLKIDRSFIRDMATDPVDRAIVEAIVVMAHKLAIRVIAEGVETTEQRDLLLAAGCDYGQGYLFARPMPAAEFEAYLAPAAPAAPLPID